MQTWQGSGQTMNRQEFATLSIAIKSAYPASKVLEDNASMDFWYTMLEDIDYKVAENAVAEHICTNIYPPNIAQIRKLCIERYRKPILSFDDAWGTVMKAISTYGWKNPQEAYTTMDDLTVSIVKNLGWSKLCHSENIDADRANFREAYIAKAQAEQVKNQLPKFVMNDKMFLQNQYISAIEDSTREKISIPQIEPKKMVNKETTLKEWERRTQMIEETRQQLRCGIKKAEKG